MSHLGACASDGDASMLGSLPGANRTILGEGAIGGLVAPTESMISTMFGRSGVQ